MSRGEGFAWLASVKLERETFGPLLRAARERKGVTLRQLAEETKLSVELWEGLEENDLSRWPRRIFARSYIRDYASRVGLDADEVVNEFCRLFPEWGDRRAERLIREKAAIVDHDLHWEEVTPAPRRRASDRPLPAPPTFGPYAHRALGASIDVLAVFSAAAVCRACGIPFWPAVAACSLLSSAATTLLSSRTFGTAAVDAALKLLRALPSHRRLAASKAQRA